MKTEEFKPRATNPTFAEIETAIHEFSQKVPWKDVIPCILTMLEEQQPKDNSYDLKFWVNVYRKKFEL